jgi:uncharacterized membrane protein YeaQ/YmgE (transglycosylase-associated protein family)
MNLISLLIFLAIGTVAGWLAGLLMKDNDFGLLGDILNGLMGAVVGGYLSGLLGISGSGLAGPIVAATFGATALLLGVWWVRRA